MRRQYILGGLGVLALLFFFQNCQNNLNAMAQKTNPLVSDPSAVEDSFSTDIPTFSEGVGCSVQFPFIQKDSDIFKVVIASQGVRQVQVSVGDRSSWSDFATINGSQQWPGNTFPLGVYTLYFRGVKSDGSNVDCSPSQGTVQVVSASAEMPITGGGAGAPGATNTGSSAVVDRSYIPLTGYSSTGVLTDSGFKNFKGIYHPEAIKNRMVYKLAPGVECHMIDTVHGSNVLRTLSANQKYRIYLPPGTMGVDVITWTYWDSTTKQAMAVRMDAAPVSSYQQALEQATLPNDGSQMDRILERLVKGEEFRSYVLEQGNMLPRVSGGTSYSSATPYVYRSPRGGWLYINQLKLIGDVAMRIETRTCVDPEVYKTWYNSAKWDSDGNPL